MCCIYLGPVIDLSSTGSLTLHHTGTFTHIINCRVAISYHIVMFQLCNVSGYHHDVLSHVKIDFCKKFDGDNSTSMPLFQSSVLTAASVS